MTFKRLALSLLILPLIGAGCFDFGAAENPSEGSLWFTGDGGLTWTQATALPQASGVTSIAGVNVTAFEIDPSDSRAFYMGTSDNGLLYSYDAGTTWMRPEDSDVSSGYIVDVQVNPENKCEIFVAKASNIYKSGDCGRTFSSAYKESRSEEAITVLEIDWYNPNVIWAGTTAGEVMKSSNSGSTWTTFYRMNDAITDIMISNADSRIILVGTEDKGLWRTTEGGSTDSWVEMEDVAKAFRGSEDVYEFAQTNDGSRVLMTSDFGLLVSDDVGETWEEVVITTSSDVPIFSVTLDPLNKDIFYYATTGTLYGTDSAGFSWATVALPSSRAPQIMTTHPESGDLLFVGFQTISN